MLLMAALTVALLLAFGSAAARAATVHGYVGQFGSPGGAAGSFSGNQGIAIDSSTGNLFVVDEWNARVQQLTTSGDPVAEWDGLSYGISQVAVDGADGRVYVTDTWGPAVDVFDASGASLGTLDTGSGWGGLGGVAVDASSGDVYVTDSGNGVVQVFDATGAHTGSFGAGVLSGPTGVAVDPSSHDVYVVDGGNGRVERFSAGGADLGTLSGVTSPVAVAVDPSNGDVYVGENASGGVQVARYDASGTRLYAFGAGRLQGIAGIATSLTSHRVYVSDPSAGVIDVFAPITVPTVTTGAATDVTGTSATFNGTINPEGATVYSYFVDYGPTASYGEGESYGNQFFFTGTSDVAVTALPVPWLPLQPNTTYHYRFGASTTAGLFYGEDQTFTTLAAPPAIDATSTAVGPDTATLHAQLNTANAVTTYHFEYGTDTSYGSASADASVGPASSDVDAAADVTGLQPDTVYHFRAVADNGTGGPVASADDTFKTAPAAAPTATDVTGVSATLSGVADVQGPGTYHFEYGKTTAYGSQTPELSALPTSGDQTLSTRVDGLDPGATYHFRLVTVLGGDTTYTADGSFTTPAPASVVTGEATDVTSSGAVLHGTVDTHGIAGSYRFRVTGVDSTVSRETPWQQLTSDAPTAVAAAIGELPAGGSYAVVLQATVGGFTSDGDPTSFQTPTAAPLVPRTAAGDAHPYGCAAPRLAQPKLPAAPGAAYTLTGSDLGLGGTVTIDGAQVQADAWSAGAVTFTVPDDATGRLDVALDCGTASNAVTITIPSNAFTIVSTRAKGTVATITLALPGPGRITASSPDLRRARRSAAKAGTYRLKLKLTRRAAAKLRHARNHRLSALVHVTFTPTGGTPATHTTTVTFKRGGRG